MSRHVLKKEQSKRDVVELALFIAQNNEPAAARFVAATEVAYERLVKMPQLGTIHKSLQPHLAGVRIWPVPGFRNHLIFYRELPDGIEVIRVLYAARDWESILESTSE